MPSGNTYVERDQVIAEAMRTVLMGCGSSCQMEFKHSATKLFISYRREPDIATAGRLFDTLNTLLPETKIFMDVDSLPAGRDFTEELVGRIKECELFLLIIGTDWLSITDEKGIRRLDKRGDMVRLEIETALQHGKQVVPVLIGQARMPSPEQVPQSIAPISRLNAVSVRHENFRRDCELLAEKIKPALAGANAASRAIRAELNAFSAETHEAQRLVAERPRGWEYLLTAELWTEKLRAPLRRIDDMVSGAYSIPKKLFLDEDASIAWLRSQIGTFAELIEPLKRIMENEFPRSCGEPGVAGNPQEILHVSRLLQRAADIIADWEETVRSCEVADRTKPLYDCLPGIAARQLKKFNDIPIVMKNEVERAVANPTEPHEINIAVEFDLPEGWVEKVEREARRFNETLPWYQDLFSTK